MKIKISIELEDQFPTLRQLKVKYIQTILEFYDWNIDLVSQILDIGRNTIYRAMKEMRIENDRDAESKSARHSGIYNS